MSECPAHYIDNFLFFGKKKTDCWVNSRWKVEKLQGERNISFPRADTPNYSSAANVAPTVAIVFPDVCWYFEIKYQFLCKQPQESKSGESQVKSEGKEQHPRSLAVAGPVAVVASHSLQPNWTGNWAPRSEDGGERRTQNRADGVGGWRQRWHVRPCHVLLEWFT